MNNNRGIDIILALLARAVVDSVYSELSKPYGHTAALILAVTTYENYFKQKLFELNPEIVFPEAGRNSININELPRLIKNHLNYSFDTVLMKQAIEDRNNLLHFTRMPSDCELTLKITFLVIVPFMEKYAANDFDTLISFIDDYDEVSITDGYLYEQLQGYKINCSTTLRNLLLSDAKII